MMKKKFNKKKASIIAPIILIILFAVSYYWIRSQRYPNTDNAYLKANVVNIATQVSGQIDRIYVDENQTVKNGALLFSIDSKPYEIALKKAKADLLLAKQHVASEIEAINVAQAVVNERKAQLIIAQQNFNRIIMLVNKGTVSKAQGDEVKASLDVAKASLAAAINQYAQAKRQLGDPNDSNPQIQAAFAQLQKAELDLKYTKINAPTDGIVSNFKLRVGDFVITGQPQFSFIDTSQWWVEANYKETALAKIKLHQKASIWIDAYPSNPFDGTVESISSGSGAEFSLLPPENATGNWVKVVQRFPVRIKILNPDAQYPFRVGASCYVHIDTKSLDK